MTSDIKRYEKVLNRSLPYGRVIRKQLMASFRASLTTFMEEESNPDHLSLCAAFGPPNEMAKLLIATLSQEELERSHKKKTASRIFAGIGIATAAVVLGVVVFSILFYYQPITVIEQNIDYGTISTTVTENTIP